MIDAVTDNYGTVQHWTTTVQAQHALGLYSYADGYGMLDTLGQAIDFDEVDPRTQPAGAAYLNITEG